MSCFLIQISSFLSFTQEKGCSPITNLGCYLQLIGGNNGSNFAFEIKNMKKIILTLLCICLAQISQSQIPSYVPKDSLVGWWPFNGNANDESGNGNNGTVNGATLTFDKNGISNSAYSFNGSSDYISITYFNKLPISKISRTISVWMQPQIQADQWTLTAVAYGQGQLHNAFMFGLAKNMVVVQSWGSGYGKNLFYNDSTWYHCVCTYFNDSVKVYVNSKLVGSGSLYDLDTKIGDLIFGGRVTKDLSFFNGKLDDIGIWNRALDSIEIQNLYNSNSAGLNPSKSINTIVLYPNPVKDVLTIQGIKDETQFQITNTIGQVFIQGKFHNQIDVSKINSGIYFLKTELGTQKFVKQ